MGPAYVRGQGALRGDALRLSEQGNELQLEFNALAPLLLTRHLRPALDASDGPVVVNTATSGMHTTSPDLAYLVDVRSFKRLVGGYLHRKSAMVHWMDDLSHEAGWEHVRLIHVNPGANLTNMAQDNGMPWWLKPLAPWLFEHPSKGGNQQYKAAFAQKFASDNRASIGGKVKPMKTAISPEARNALLAGIRAPTSP